MSKSQMVYVKDVYRIIRLNNELDDLPASRPQRMQHIAQTVCHLFHAKLGAIGFGEGFLATGRPKFTGAVGAGSVDDSELRVFARYVAGDATVDPCIMPMASNRRPQIAVRRRDIVDDRTWYNSPHVADDRKAANVDDVVYSIQRLDKAGAIRSIAVHRAWNDRIKYREKDRVLLRLLHTAVANKVQPARVMMCERLARQLSPRVRQTLERLLLGEPEKEIATALGLSRHTVHGYVKAIYSHYSVTSRPELLAMWVETARYEQ